MEFPDAPTLFVWFLATLYALDRASSALSQFGARLGRMGRLPESLKGWDRRRAHALVDDERRAASLALLLKHSDAILTAVTVTGNGGVADRVKRIETTVETMAKNVEAHMHQSARDAARLRSVERRLARHVAKREQPEE